MAALLLPLNAAQAHSVSVSRGTLWIDPDRLRVELLIPADDLLHTFRPPPDERDRLRTAEVDELAQRYAALVLKQFIIRDADGLPLPGRLRAASHDLPGADAHDDAAVRRARLTFVLEYALSAPPRYLTLQQTFFSGGISHAAQLALDVRATATATAPALTVVLTNRGNAETIEIDWTDAGAPRVLQPERFRGVRAQVNLRDSALDLEIQLPLTLFETWRPVPRADADFLSPAEQSALLREWSALLSGACTMQIDGRPAAPRIDALGLLAPDQLALPAAAPSRRLSAWNARLGGVLRYPHTRPPREIALTWTLFNNAVLETQLTLTAGDRQSAHLLTTYSPTLSWSRD